LASRFQRRPPSAQAADLFEMARIPESYRTLLEANFRALRSYVPRPYAGRVALFKARSQPLFRWHEPLMGWKQLLTGPVEYTIIPGSHDRILRNPCVSTLAERLAASLERAWSMPPSEDRHD